MTAYLQLFKTFLLTVFVFISCFQTTKATSVLGGEITYKTIGNKNCEVQLTIYRKCTEIIDMEPVKLNILPVACSAVPAFEAVATANFPKDMTPVCPKICTKCIPEFPWQNNGNGPDCENPFGISAQTFTATVDLSAFPENCCEFIVSYTECCRDSSSTNISANQNFYIQSKLKTCKLENDNSWKGNSIVSQYPIIAILVRNQCQSISFGVYEPDGDSLVYSLTEPLSAPVTQLNYTGSFSAQSPLIYAGFPDANAAWDVNTCRGFHLNKHTGILNFTPVAKQKAIIAVKIEKWRKDSAGIAHLTGEITREILVDIIDNTTINHSPKLSGINGTDKDTIRVAPGAEVSFIVYSSDADADDTLRMGWDYGIKGATFNVEANKALPRGKFTWNPGPQHVRSAPHTFTVHAIDNHCPVNGRWSRTFSVIVDENYNIPDTLRGRVLTSYFEPLANSRVQVLMFNANDTTLNLVKNAATDSTGFYEVILEDTSIKQVYVLALPDTVFYPNEIPSYYTNAVTVQDARMVQRVKSNNITVNFNTVFVDNPGGAGIISGKVSKCITCKKAGPGAAVEGLKLILMNEFDAPQAYTFTDDNGGFEFENISLEKYKIWVDKAFVNNAKAPQIELNVANNSAEELDFFLYPTYLELVKKIGIKEEVAKAENRIGLFPNPASNVLTILAEKEEIITNIVFTNTLGQQLLQLNNLNTNKHEINVQKLTEGIYIVQVRLQNGSEIKRIFVKQ